MCGIKNISCYNTKSIISMPIRLISNLMLLIRSTTMPNNGWICRKNEIRDHHGETKITTLKELIKKCVIIFIKKKHILLILQNLSWTLLDCSKIGAQVIDIAVVANPFYSEIHYNVTHEQLSKSYTTYII